MSANHRFFINYSKYRTTLVVFKYQKLTCGTLFYKVTVRDIYSFAN